jgi:hypothetical protein
VAEPPAPQGRGARRPSVGTLVGLGTFVAATLDLGLAAWSSWRRKR